MKMIKKILIALFVVCALAFMFKAPSVNADEIVTSNQLKIDGVSVRLTGHVGIRFQASVGTYDTSNVKKYGVLLSFGYETQYNEMKEKYVPDFTGMVKDAWYGRIELPVLSVEVDELDSGHYYATIYDIPESGYIQQVCARPYVVLNDDSIVYADMTNAAYTNVASLADVCAMAYEDKVEGDIIDDVMATINIVDVSENELSVLEDLEMSWGYTINKYVDDDYAGEKKYIAQRRTTESDDKEYHFYRFFEKGEVAFDNIADALSNAEDQVIYVFSGDYPGNFTIEDDCVCLIGPNFDKEINESRNPEANITGVVTLAPEIESTRIDGLKFSGQSKIVAQCNNATANVCYNLVGFEFYDNYVVSSLASGHGFLDFDTNVTGGYRYNQDFVFSQNHFETTNDYAAEKFMWFGDNDGIMFECCDFINVKKDCIYVQDYGKGLAGDFRVKDCHFENIGGYGININWVASLKSGEEPSHRNTISIKKNYFESIADGNNCAYINFENSNNLQNYLCFEIVFNTFKGNTRVLWFDGRIATGADFKYNKIYTNNTNNYICKSDYTTAEAASNCEIDCSNNIYINMSDDSVITGANINDALFQPAIAKNYTTSFDTLEAYETEVNALLN